MEAGLLSERLKDAAESLGIEVRGCSADLEGGAAVLRGRRVIFVPEGAPAGKRVEIIARALAHEDVERVFLLPAVREAIEREGT